MSKAMMIAVALLGFSSTAFAQELPKEGPINSSATFHSFTKSVTAETLIQISYDAKGGFLADKPGGFMDRVTARCVGGIRAVVQGKIEHEYNMCEFTDMAGDKFYSKLEHVSSEPDKVVNKALILGGTGKYKGITGGWEVTRRSLKPFADGESMSVVKVTGNYKLP